MDETLSVQHAYSLWAPTYDDVENPLRDLDAVTLRASDLPIEGQDLVELGAGTGKNTGWLARRARSLIALDFSEEMLAVARQRHDTAGVRFERHDVRAPWPVESGSVDVVFANLILEHIDDIGPVFAHAFSALRPGGKLYISELHPFRQLRGSQARFDQDGKTLQVQAHYHSISEFFSVAQDVGFELTTLHEHTDPGQSQSPEHPPRLLVAVFEKNRP